MNDYNELMMKIQKYDFTLKELNLYLDTHPNCRRALAMFNKYKKLKTDAEKEFNQLYGPLTPIQNNSTTDWHWVSDPWPWERS
ncbi:MAG: spore coat protein CotJB [Oscillospiraceae bacterium]|nr:spore coat protein CotJB [Oscillospiraceae bacterium]